MSGWSAAPIAFACATSAAGTASAYHRATVFAGSNVHGPWNGCMSGVLRAPAPVGPPPGVPPDWSHADSSTTLRRSGIVLCIARPDVSPFIILIDWHLCQSRQQSGFQTAVELSGEDDLLEFHRCFP